MHPRHQKLLSILLRNPNQYMYVQDLAGELNCSEKTVRNDLKSIELLLHEEDWKATINRKPGFGVSLNINEAEKSSLYNYVYQEDTKTEEDQDDLVMQLAYDLLMAKSPKTINGITSTYFAPKSQVKRDLEEIHHWLENFDLTLITKKRVGIYIEGTEKNKRNALARVHDLSHNQTGTDHLIKRLFNNHEVSIIKNELDSFQRKHELYFTDDTVNGLTLHILLMIKRVKIGDPIQLSPNEFLQIKQKKEYAWTKELLHKLQSTFVVRFPETEIAYITLHILGGKVRFDSTDESHPSLSPITEYMIERMTELSELSFDKDTQLKNGLQTHLNTTLHRLDYAFSVSNPMLEDIKKMYPHMFDQVLLVLEDVQQHFSYKIPEEEAAYITLHFQAALERLTSQEGIQKKVLIVCHMGIGMSQLLQTKIERKFQTLTVVDSIARADLSHYLRQHQVDFVISTIPLENISTPHIVVSPLLEAKDEQKLEAFIKEKPEEEKQESVLLTFTSPFLVNLQHPPVHRYELIEELATQLYKKGYVEEEYIHTCLLRERSASTNIGGGIAIPHGNPNYIKQSAVAIATLKEPIQWGTEKVSFICLLAVHSQNREETKRLFQELSELSENPDHIQRLTQEKDAMSFLSSLKS